MIRLELPLPPSANVYYRMGPNRSPEAKVPCLMHISAAGRAYRRLVRLVWRSQRGKAIEGPCYVFGALWFPTMASDVDNRIKPALDALQHAGVYANDRQVADLQFFRAGTVGRGNEGTLLIEVGPYGWRNQTVAEFKRQAGW